MKHSIPCWFIVMLNIFVYLQAGKLPDQLANCLTACYHEIHTFLQSLHIAVSFYHLCVH